MSMHKILSASSILLLLLAQPVAATVHLFHIEELYSTPSGTLQFIELDTAFNNQNLFKTGGNNSRLVSKTAANDVHATFFFPNDLPTTATADHSVLVGTANVLAIGGVAPDFIIPNNFLLLEGGILEFTSDVFGTFNTVILSGIADGQGFLRRSGGFDRAEHAQEFCRRRGPGARAELDRAGRVVAGRRLGPVRAARCKR